jgi:formylglycine-generating enzyme required for sulfatase activity
MRTSLFCAVATLCASATISACNKSGGNAGGAGRAPKDSDFPPEVTVGGQAMVEGFAGGSLRRSRTIDGFRITKYPITIAEFRRCVDAGQCATPSEDGCFRVGNGPTDGPNFKAAQSDREPATCVGAEQARKYCSWLGGRLPKLGEWLLATRGTEVRRFPWGNQLAKCEQHPAGHFAETAPCPDERLRRFEVGLHKAGASSSGVEDALLTRGELLASDKHSTFSACSGPYQGCIVSGLHPGAMDGVEPVLKAGGAEATPSAMDKTSRPPTNPGDASKAKTPYGFRCVWTKGGAA